MEQKTFILSDVDNGFGRKRQQCAVELGLECMMTSTNGNIFCVTGPLWGGGGGGDPPDSGGFPSLRPV